MVLGSFASANRAKALARHTILSAYDSDTLTGTNRTLPAHELYDGYVQRTLVTYDGAIWVRTVGEGYNVGRLSQWFNQILGPDAFISEDRRFRLDVYNDWRQSIEGGGP
jgi:hypothetical protein